MLDTSELSDRIDDPSADPFDRFTSLLDAAMRIDRSVLPEPTAFSLATVSGGGTPSVRIVLLKAVENGGFVFYTNFESRKSEELRATKRAALCFHWQPLERQVRAEGRVEVVDAAEADAYFATRPRGSQLGAWASKQSRPMERETSLDERLAEFAARFEGGPVPRPPHWGGWRLMPERIEFWRGMPSRLHVRHLYERVGGRGWGVELLYP